MAEKDIATMQTIMEAGRKEFLEKGLKEASLRNIAKRCDITPGGFYFYFKDKKALFNALVSPAISGFIDLYESEQQAFDQLSGDIKQDNLIENDKYTLLVDFIYDHYEDFKLLVTCSDGTVFNDFLHNVVEIDVNYTMKFIESTGNDALISGRGSPELFHMLSWSFLAGLFETVVHDMNKEQAVIYVNQLNNFFINGWSQILGITQ